MPTIKLKKYRWGAVLVGGLFVVSGYVATALFDTGNAVAGNPVVRQPSTLTLNGSQKTWIAARITEIWPSATPATLDEFRCAFRTNDATGETNDTCAARDVRTGVSASQAVDWLVACGPGCTASQPSAGVNAYTLTRPFGPTQLSAAQSAALRAGLQTAYAVDPALFHSLRVWRPDQVGEPTRVDATLHADTTQDAATWMDSVCDASGCDLGGLQDVVQP